MNILWIIDGLGPGGAEGLMPSLLSGLARVGVSSRVCVLQVRGGNPVANLLRERGVEVDLVEVDSLHSLAGILRLFSYIKRTKPDVIHTQLETSDILGGVIGTLLGIPVVSTLHTLSLPSRKRTSSFRHRVRRFALNHFFRYVIAVSNETRRHFVGLGIESQKLLTIYNGIELDRFARIYEAGHASPVSGREDVILMTVAVLREAKGIQYMLNAMPDILRSQSKVKYVVVGDGEHRVHLEATVHDLHLVDRVVFWGFRSDIPEVLAQGDIFIFPTLNDALPTVLLEAMASGRPVIASRVGGVPEIITDGVTGILVPPGDSAALAAVCLQMISDTNMRDRLITSARKDVVDRFDVSRQAATLLVLYQKILGENEK